MLNFNTQPYYDDFNEDKNYHRILFKPGVAVQARELTQAQSILQDQIGKFGKFVLSDGSNVSGGKYHIDTNTLSLNLKDSGQISTDIEHFTGMYVIGETSRCMGLITSADILNYYIYVKSSSVKAFTSEETLHLFSTKSSAYQYLFNDSAIQADYTAILKADVAVNKKATGQKDSYTFDIISSTLKAGDIITVNSDNKKYIITNAGADNEVRVNVKLADNYNNTDITITSPAASAVMEVGFDEGVYFTNGVFVKALPQSIIPNSATQYPNCVIGYEVQETISDFIDDSSLLDPAQGAYNYTAPGADRYKIYLNLVSVNLINSALDETTLTTTKFIELLRIKNGVVVSDSTSPVLGGLEDILAKQMYDHAGNFIISPFNISFAESDFSDRSTKLTATVSPGRAYVYGRPFNATFPTNISIDKTRNIETVTSQNINTYYGNYIRISGVTGKLPVPSIGSKIELHSTDTNSISNSSLLGYAYVRNIDYTTVNEYSLFLYNVGVSETALLTANSVKSTSGGFKANTILSSAGKNVTYDPQYNRLLFKLPYPNAASIYDASIILDKFETGVAVSALGVATISTNSLTKEFSSGVGNPLPVGLKTENFIIVAKSTAGPYTAGEYVDLTSSAVVIKVEKLDSSYKATITFTNGYTGQIDIKYSIVYTSASAKTKTLVQNKVTQVNVRTVPTSIGYADVVAFKGIYATKNSNAALSTYNDAKYTGAITYTAGQVVKSGSNLYMCTSDTIGKLPGSIGAPWVKLNDVSSLYKKDNGQKEYMYDHGTISALSSADTGVVFVLFDYYEHSSDGEFISFSSYLTSKSYNEIPQVTINNIAYSLRDYIDFRPRRKDKPSDGSADSDIILYDSSYAIPTSITDPKFNYSMTYYLGRIDKLILNKGGTLEWLTGKSSFRNYVPPQDIPTAMTIASIQIEPYALNIQGIKVSYTKHRRYTMDDIGGLDTRLQNVEYYTALNMGEKATLSTNITDEYGTRLKNGFIVDGFTNLSVVDLSQNDKNISFDTTNNLAKPYAKWNSYDKSNIQYSFDTILENNGADISLLHVKNKEINIIGFPYHGKLMKEQTQATGIQKINQFDKISYHGHLSLSPSSQVYNDTVGSNVNTVDDNTADIMNAAENPGLFFSAWSTLGEGELVDKSSSVVVTYNNEQYNVSTKLTNIQPVKKDPVLANIKPKARSIKIEFTATGLAPMTRMYVYVNNRHLGGYVTPSENPTGMITGINIDNKGAGYGVTTATVNAVSPAATIPATVEVVNAGSWIQEAFITNPGSGYHDLIPTVTLTSSTTPTTIAKLSLSTTPKLGTDLYTNKYGECSGTLMLPNIEGVISFEADELTVTVCDTPHLDLENAISRADATFYASTQYTTNNTNSVRKPYITKITSGSTLPPVNQSPMIIVPTNISYLTENFSLDYTTNVAPGTLSIPIYLNQRPSADVQVSYLFNASEDASANVFLTEPTFSATTFTFTPSNWSSIQTLTITYNLGPRASYTVDTITRYIDNNLPTHMEFYATSDDPNFNHPPTALPIKSWLMGKVVTGVSAIHLTPYKHFTAKEVDDSGTQPYMYLSPIQTSNVGGQSFVTVSYGGGPDIGWWNDTSITPYPLTFTATSDNSNVVIDYSEYNEFEEVKKTKGGILTVGKTDHQQLTFKYWLYGASEGIANVSVQIASANPAWNSTLVPSLGKTVRATVGPALLAPTPDIVVHSNFGIDPSSGTNLIPARITTSQGTTSLIGITLSKAPSAGNTVIVKANSSVIVGGGEIYNVSNNGITITSGNTVLFTPSNWDQMKTFIVTGTDDSTKTTDLDVPYKVMLKATSGDTNYSGKFTTVDLINKDKGDEQGEIYAEYSSASQGQTTNGSSIPIMISLKKYPGASNVRVYCTSSSDAIGFITTTSTYGANGIIQFDGSKPWNVPQQIMVKGVNITGTETQNFNITCTPKEWDTVTDKQITNTIWTKPAIVKLTNTPYTYTTRKFVDVDRTEIYTATANGRVIGQDEGCWRPDFTISTPASIKKVGTGTTTSTGSGSAAQNAYVTILSQDTDGTIKLKANVAIKPGTVVTTGGQSDSTWSKTTIVKASATVQFKLRRGANNDCFIPPDASFESTNTAKSILVSTIPANSPAADKPAMLPFNSPSLPGDEIGFEIEFFTGSTIAAFANYEDTFTIKSVKYDAISAGFDVKRTIGTTESTTTYRMDAGQIVQTADGKDVYVAPTTYVTDHVPWTLNGKSIQAAIDSIHSGSFAVNQKVFWEGDTTGKYSPILPNKQAIPLETAAFTLDTYNTRRQKLVAFMEDIRTKIRDNGDTVDLNLQNLLNEEQSKLNEYDRVISTLNQEINTLTFMNR